MILDFIVGTVGTWGRGGLVAALVTASTVAAYVVWSLLRCRWEKLPIVIALFGLLVPAGIGFGMMALFYWRFGQWPKSIFMDIGGVALGGLIGIAMWAEQEKGSDN